MISVHVDVDNLQVYEEEYGVSFEKTRDYIFDQALLLALDVFGRLDIQATFFVVGRDLELESARRFCRRAVQLGHAIGNHTYSHRVDFATLSYEEKKEEIERCDRAIVDAVGVRPIGFRAPGYYIDSEIVRVLSQIGYSYDSSVLPGFACHLMSIYAQIKGGASSKKKFGKASYLITSRKPFTMQSPDSSSMIKEFPISVAPFFRLPVHTTFMYLLGYPYFNFVKMLYRLSPQHHIYLFHAIDFVDLSEYEHTQHPVVPLHWKHHDRIALVEQILIFLKTLSKEKIKTTESYFQHA